MALRLIASSVFRQSRNVTRIVQRSAKLSTTCIRKAEAPSKLLVIVMYYFTRILSYY